MKSATVPDLPPFSPARWARGPNAQTLCARLLRPKPTMAMERERLETPDGDFIDVDWAADAGPGSPIALVLHGLEGSSTRRYIHNLCRQLGGRGVRTVAMNFRGCSGAPNRALRFYHSGDTADAAWLLGRIRERHPHSRIGAMGFSLGGNVLLKLMGERSDGGVGLLDAAAVMSVPYDLSAGSTELERTRMGRVYAAYFLRSLQKKVASKWERLGAALDLEAVRRVRTIRDFDERVTAPLNGFVDAEDYYSQSSSVGYLNKIQVPTFLLHAEDDPFLPRASIPTDPTQISASTRLVLTHAGGHVGFLAGSPRAPNFWGEAAVARFLADSLVEPSGR
ncbi:MAG: hydrolase [Gemmatimonadetes bacterium]|nr:hydrolase [Gemmatimonadota bacterium]MDA1104028.1 hydrolase [Gemmatimonadota bacterium]